MLDERTAELLAHGTPATYPVSLAASYQIAFDRLAKQAPAALALLTLAAHLAPEPIPRTLFTTHPDQLPDPLGTTARDPLAFTELTRLLRRAGLARVEPDSLQLHRLLQTMLRTEPDQHDMAIVAIRLLRAVVPADPWDNPPTWPLWRELLPHVLAATDARHTPDPTGDDVAWLLDHAGTYVLTHGEPVSARPLFERALSLRRSLLGEDHPDILESASNLAVNLSELGQYEQARQLEDDTLTRRRRVLGEDHPSTPVSASNLAYDLHQLGHYEQARQLQQDTLTRKRRVLGEDHPSTLASAGNLALDLRALGHHEQARQLQQDTLTRRRRVLGEDHPRTLASASNLVADLRALGRDDEANQLEEWVRYHS